MSVTPLRRKPRPDALIGDSISTNPIQKINDNTVQNVHTLNLQQSSENSAYNYNQDQYSYYYDGDYYNKYDSYDYYANQHGNDQLMYNQHSTVSSYYYSGMQGNSEYEHYVQQYPNIPADQQDLYQQQHVQSHQHVQPHQHVQTHQHVQQFEPHHLQSGYYFQEYSERLQTEQEKPVESKTAITEESSKSYEALSKVCDDMWDMSITVQTNEALS